MADAQALKGSIEATVECGAWFEADPAATELAADAANETLVAAADPRGAGYILEVVLSDNAHVGELNRRHRGKDKPTNVLSFSAPADFGTEHAIGSVVLAFETVVGEAREQGKTLRDHLQHLVVHGVLHLLGHDHETDEDAEDMEALERSILAGLGVADPYAGRD
jgi:probable rRNA maturation factor